MPQEYYEQRGTDIMFKGKRVVSCFGTNTDMNESESEAFALAQVITDKLNYDIDTLAFFDPENIKKYKCANDMRKERG